MTTTLEANGVLTSALKTCAWLSAVRDYYQLGPSYGRIYGSCGNSKQ